MSKSCYKCGAVLDDDALFCDECGEKQIEGRKVVEAEESNSVYGDKRYIRARELLTENPKDKVAIIKRLKEEFGGELAEAKQIVDDVLEDEKIKDQEKNFAETSNGEKKEKIAENSQSAEENKEIGYTLPKYDGYQYSTDKTKKIKHRNFGIFLLLGFVTCGIYSIYAMWMIIKDINTVCEEDAKKSPNLLVVLLLSCVTFGIYGIYWYYAQGKRLYEIAPRYGCDVKENGMNYVLWMLLIPWIGGLVATCKIFKNLNMLGNAYNNNVITNEPLKKQKITITQKIVFGIIIFLTSLFFYKMISTDNSQVPEEDYYVNDVSDEKEEEITQENKDALRKECIFPDSSEKYLSEDDVRRVEVDKLSIGRNEIFARHGYIFNDESLKQYFEATSWYHGTVTAEEFNTEQLFNDFEKKNVELIKKIENEIKIETEKQVVIEEAYKFVVGKHFWMEDSETDLEFVSNEQVMERGYYDTKYFYSFSADYELHRDEYQYLLWLNIDGERYYFRYFEDGTICLEGDGSFSGWYAPVEY